MRKRSFTIKYRVVFFHKTPLEKRGERKEKMETIKKWWNGLSWMRKTSVWIAILIFVALVWMLWPNGSDNATQTSSSISTVARVDSAINALEQKIQEAENLANSSANTAETNAKKYAAGLYFDLAAMDTSMADSLSKKFRGQLNAELTKVAKKAATDDREIVDKLIEIDGRVVSQSNRLSELKDSVVVVAAVARGAEAKATQAAVDAEDLRQILREMAQDMQGSREPLLFGKKGAVHRAATAAVEALGGAEDTVRAAADEQEVMRLLGIESSSADTTATE